jgi:uncharacterized protein YecT (DUF1311 family)
MGLNVIAGIFSVAMICNSGTTYDMRACWSREDTAAGNELKAAYAAVVASYARAGRDSAPLAAAQKAWVRARDATCAFEYELYLPGTIAPQLGEECSFRMTRARTSHLTALLREHSGAPQPSLSSAAADAALDRFYHAYLARLAGAQRSSLAASQAAWSAYRDKACAVSGGSCARDLAKERVAELQQSWIGEPFW